MLFLKSMALNLSINVVINRYGIFRLIFNVLLFYY